MTMWGILGAFIACCVGYVVGFLDAKTHFEHMIREHIEFIENAIKKSKGGNSK